jgi:hypothetical protein
VLPGPEPAVQLPARGAAVLRAEDPQSAADVTVNE